MLSYSNYLAEAKVSKSNLNKVANIFKRIAERELSTKLYRFGGPEGYSETKNGIGILYFYDKNKAMRINYSSGEITSITLWKQFGLNKKGDFTIELGDASLLDAGKQLIQHIKNPKVTKFGVMGDLTEGYLTEAARVKPEDFVDIVKNNLTSGLNINNLSWEELKAIAIDADVLVPSAVKKTHIKGTKGKNAKFDVTKLVDMKDSDKVSAKNEPIYYVKITAQDPETKKFLSVKGDKKAESLLTTMTTSINKPDVDKEMKDPDALFGIMANLTQLVARGSRNSLIVYGGPGIGKTHVVNQTLNSEGLTKGEDYFVVKGKITTTSLYQTLFMHRKGGILVFDDTDSVWGDKEAANILKAALDSYDERTISWMSNRTINVGKLGPAEKEEINDKIDLKLATDPSDSSIKFPSEFEYEGRIIFISNLPYEKFDPAVLTRSAKIDMTLTKEQIFMRMKSIIASGGLGSKDVPNDVKSDIVEFLMQSSATGKLDAPSLRTYIAAEDLYKSGLPNWKDLLEYV